MARTRRPVPFFYLGVIVFVAAVFGFAIYRGSGSDDTQVTVLGTRTAGAAVRSASVEFVSPLDGAVVQNPIEVRVAVGGAVIKPATEPAQPGAGHFRVLVDIPDPLTPGQRPNDQYTAADLVDGSHVMTLPQLPPGAHTLSVVFEDSNHALVEGVVPQTIKITVSG